MQWTIPIWQQCSLLARHWRLSALSLDRINTLTEENIVTYSTFTLITYEPLSNNSKSTYSLRTLKNRSENPPTIIDIISVTSFWRGGGKRNV
jgi:hypothetical protein